MAVSFGGKLGGSFKNKAPTTSPNPSPSAPSPSTPPPTPVSAPSSAQTTQGGATKPASQSPPLINGSSGSLLTPGTTLRGNAGTAPTIIRDGRAISQTSGSGGVVTKTATQITPLTNAPKQNLEPLDKSLDTQTLRAQARPLRQDARSVALADSQKSNVSDILRNSQARLKKNIIKQQTPSVSPELVNTPIAGFIAKAKDKSASGALERLGRAEQKPIEVQGFIDTRTDSQIAAAKDQEKQENFVKGSVTYEGGKIIKNVGSFIENRAEANAGQKTILSEKAPKLNAALNTGIKEVGTTTKTFGQNVQDKPIQAVIAPIAITAGLVAAATIAPVAVTAIGLGFAAKGAADFITATPEQRPQMLREAAPSILLSAATATAISVAPRVYNTVKAGFTKIDVKVEPTSSTARRTTLPNAEKPTVIDESVFRGKVVAGKKEFKITGSEFSETTPLGSGVLKNQESGAPRISGKNIKGGDRIDLSKVPNEQKVFPRSGTKTQTKIEVTPTIKKVTDTQFIKDRGSIVTTQKGKVVKDPKPINIEVKSLQTNVQRGTKIESRGVSVATENIPGRSARVSGFKTGSTGKSSGRLGERAPTSREAITAAQKIVTKRVGAKGSDVDTIGSIAGKAKGGKASVVGAVVESEATTFTGVKGAEQRIQLLTVESVGVPARSGRVGKFKKTDTAVSEVKFTKIASEGRGNNLVKSDTRMSDTVLDGVNEVATLTKPREIKGRIQVQSEETFGIIGSKESRTVTTAVDRKVSGSSKVDLTKTFNKLVENKPVTKSKPQAPQKSSISGEFLPGKTDAELASAREAGTLKILQNYRNPQDILKSQGRDFGVSFELVETTPTPSRPSAPSTGSSLTELTVSPRQSFKRIFTGEAQGQVIPSTPRSVPKTSSNNAGFGKVPNVPPNVPNRALQSSNTARMQGSQGMRSNQVVSSNGQVLLVESVKQNVRSASGAPQSNVALGFGSNQQVLTEVIRSSVRSSLVSDALATPLVSARPVFPTRQSNNNNQILVLEPQQINTVDKFNPPISKDRNDLGQAIKQNIGNQIISTPFVETYQGIATPSTTINRIPQRNTERITERVTDQIITPTITPVNFIVNPPPSIVTPTPPFVPPFIPPFSPGGSIQSLGGRPSRRKRQKTGGRPTVTAIVFRIPGSKKGLFDTSGIGIRGIPGLKFPKRK